MADETPRALKLIRDAFNDPPWLDTAVSRVLLEHAATNATSGTLRVFRPAPVVAFGPADRIRRGYPEARRAAAAAGFTPVNRLAGGHAAIFHAGTIALCWTVPDEKARAGIRERFQLVSALIAQALRRLGLDARVGAVEGEYCPGSYSVNVSGRTKIAGIAQRVLPRAAHVGGVIVVDGHERVRETLRPVYDALELDWDPATASSLRNEGLTASWDEVAEALIDEVEERFEVVVARISPGLLARAYATVPRSESPEGLHAATEGLT